MARPRRPCWTCAWRGCNSADIDLYRRRDELPAAEAALRAAAATDPGDYVEFDLGANRALRQVGWALRVPVTADSAPASTHVSTSTSSLASSLPASPTRPDPWSKSTYPASSNPPTSSTRRPTVSPTRSPRSTRSTAVRRRTRGQHPRQGPDRPRPDRHNSADRRPGAANRRPIRSGPPFPHAAAHRHDPQHGHLGHRLPQTGRPVIRNDQLPHSSDAVGIVRTLLDPILTSGARGTWNPDQATWREAT